ncbi:hypothetical protein M2132_001658 [Dysgonomonas sp. PH5-45]|uniref:DUF6383 domain-containing protein n=1 Tax=unclassified Dysgonomonas TaxID=2630389 RepID=UPI0024766A9E|nr:MULTISPECIES: DUF6383 domain-containing protein [unclassified Dysgonomonas]MDH6355317.1 hypothetical protein [Dysgonomonas sp. PH5-45]MDH6388215.1 hypothetical protein [Dysgonomonas sp. PH5-37]
MKNFRVMTLMLLALFSSISLKAEALKQNFNDNFASSSYTTSTTDGWSYQSLARETYAANVFEGTAAVTLYTRSTEGSLLANLTSPAKTGGVGLVSFWYKSYRTTTSIANYELEVQVSADNITFTTVETVLVNAADATTYNRFSKVINRTDAKHVRIEAKQLSTDAYINIDEFVITDAVSGGSAANVNISFNGAEGEINVTNSKHITINGTNVSGDLTVSLKAANSYFSLSSDKVTVTGTQANQGYNLPVTFIPRSKYLAHDTLVISGSGMPEMMFPIKAVALERTMGENFNDSSIPTYPSTFNYMGWNITNGSRVSSTNSIYEGSGSLRFYTSVISPKKAGGIGEISFVYRAETTTNQVECVIYTSPDGVSWIEVDTFTATSEDFQLYRKMINDPYANYVKLVTTNNTSSHTLIIDLFVVTENNRPMATASVGTTRFETTSVPYAFNVPVSFENILAYDVNLSVAQNQFGLEKTTIPAIEAVGTIQIPMTYTPQEGSNFAQDTLVISGGNLPFVQRVPITVYYLSDMIFSGFDAMWGLSYPGNYITDGGWVVKNGSRATGTNTALKSAAAVSLSQNGTLVSPPKSGGIGSIEFYGKVASGTADIIVAISEDGNTWTDKETISVSSSTYISHKLNINDATAKYVRFLVTSNISYITFYIDNVTIMKNGTGVADVEQLAVPVFEAKKNEESTKNIDLKGANITTDVNVSLASGTAFSLKDISSIPAASINNKTYSLPLTFNPQANGYILDTLIISGKDLSYKRHIPLEGYVLRSNAHQDFNGAWVFENNVNNISGWKTSGTANTSSSMLYDGTKGLSLSASNMNGAYLLSVPKSDGVGIISFQYRSGSAIDVKVFTYKDLSEEPKEVDSFSTSASQTYALYEKVVDDADAKYVEIRLPKHSNYVTLYMDEVAITASGKKIPVVTIPEVVTIDTYPNESKSKSFQLDFENVEQDVTMSLLDGTKFNIGKTLIETDGTIQTETIAVDFILNENDDLKFYPDTILIDGDGLMKPLYVPLAGVVMQDNLFQDFEKEGWLPMEGNTNLDGWVMTAARRDMMAKKEGTCGLTLNFTKTKIGSITSPPKSGGVNEIEFYYRNTATGGFDVLVSADGENWIEIDNVTLPSYSTSFELYNKKVADADSKYVRIQTHFGTSTYNSSLYIDSLSITGMPYLRQVGTVDSVDTEILPVNIPVKVAGILKSDASITLKGGSESVFTLTKQTLTPADVTGGTIVPFELTFTVPEDQSGEYADTVVISNEDVETIEIPVYVNYTQPFTGQNGESLIHGNDFEIQASIGSWKTFDLDGKALSFHYTGNPKGWFWNYESIADMEGNKVLSASSTFINNTPDNITPADDWLFTPALVVPETGSYEVSWDARSLHELFLESYEMRVIEDDILSELEAGFTENTPLATVSEILVENSDLILSVVEESKDWNHRFISLNPYKGKTVRVIWRHISENKHTLHIDNFKYYSQVLDVQFTELPDITYTQVPEFAVKDVSPVAKVAVTNGGTTNLNNVSITVNAYDANDVSLYSKQFGATTLEAETPFYATTDNAFSLLNNKRYYSATVTSDEGYTKTVNTGFYEGTVLTDSVYAWDNGDVTGGVYSSSMGFEVGQVFPVSVDSWLWSVAFRLTENTTATSVKLNVYKMEGDDMTLLTTVDATTTTPATAATYVAQIDRNDIQLLAGEKYFVSLAQTNGEELYLAKTSNEISSIAAYYTTKNAEWTWLDKDHTLYLRLNVSEEQKMGIEGTTANNVEVYFAKDGNICISGAVAGTPVSVYDVKGQPLYQSVIGSENERLNVNVPNGVYVVRLGEASHKVVK